MFGLTPDKLIVFAVIAAFLIGPERLPAAARRLRDLVRAIRKVADDTKDRIRDEVGPEFDDIQWNKLDPRQYDPRRIIRDALVDDTRSSPGILSPPNREQVTDSTPADPTFGAPASAFQPAPIPERAEHPTNS